MALGTLKRRLDKIEASMPVPDQKIYQFIAPQGDPCLDAEPPWGGLSVFRIMVGPEGGSDMPSSHCPNIQRYAQAQKAWEEHGTAPLSVEEWRGTVESRKTAKGYSPDPLLSAEIMFVDGMTRGKLPREAVDEAARWATRLIEPRN